MVAQAQMATAFCPAVSEGTWSSRVERWAMSFRLSFHQASLGPTGAHWLDDPSDVSCKETTRQYPVDGPLLSCNELLIVG
jgi:hypothetical protein